MRKLLRGLAAAFAAAAVGVFAQEVTFYYSIAVGGPFTKIVDQMAAYFDRENPGN